MSEPRMYQSLSEIFDQARELRLTYDALRAQPALDAFSPDAYDEIVLVACGSSYWMALSAAPTLTAMLGKRVTCVKSGDVLLHPELYATAYRRPLLLLPSRSGATGETIAALDCLRAAYGCPSFAIVEAPDAPLATMATRALCLPWAREATICQTRSCCCLYLAMVMMAARASGDEALLRGMDEYIDLLGSIAARVERETRDIVHSFPYRSVVALGSGKGYGACVEGAYVGIEMARQPANYYATLEYRHGPIVMADEDTLVCLFATGAGLPLERAMAADVRAKGARLLAITDAASMIEAEYAICAGKPLCPEAQALFGLFVMQGLAVHKAVAMGLDPDAPDLPPYIEI